MKEEFTDVLILGPGLVGMATLIALEKYTINTALLLDSKITKNRAQDPRFYTITPGVKKWFEENDIWTFLSKKSVSIVKTIMVYSGKENTSLKFDAYDAGINELAFIVSHDDLEKAFIDRLAKINYKEIKTNKLESLTAGINNISLVYGNDKKHKFKLVIGADGSNSWVRTQSSIHFKSKNFDQTAIVFNIKNSKAHQGCAYQKFMHHGILALLPVNKDEFAVVFSLNNNIVDDYRNLDDAMFIQKLKDEMCEMFSDIILLTRRQYFPLEMKINESLISDRVLLIGDAAHQIHPLAGQGLNLGLRDVIELDKLLYSNKKYHHDLGLKYFLKKYNRIRKTDILSFSYLTEQLSYLFSSKNHMVNLLVNFGLNKINQNQLIKKNLIRKAIH